MLFSNHVQLHSYRHGVKRELDLTWAVFLPVMKLNGAKKSWICANEGL